MEKAAVMIQTKVRQVQAKNRVGAMRHEKQAAVKIQAGYRGFKARQKVRRMKYATAYCNNNNNNNIMFTSTLWAIKNVSVYFQL